MWKTRFEVLQGLAQVENNKAEIAAIERLLALRPELFNGVRVLCGVYGWILIVDLTDAQAAFATEIRFPINECVTIRGSSAST